MRNIISDSQEDALLLTLDTNTRSVIRNNLIYVSTDGQILSIVNVGVLSARSQTSSSAFCPNLNLLDKCLTSTCSKYYFASRASPCTLISIKSIRTSSCGQIITTIKRDNYFLNSRTCNSQRVTVIQAKGLTRVIHPVSRCI